MSRSQYAEMASIRMKMDAPIQISNLGPEAVMQAHTQCAAPGFHGGGECLSGGRATGGCGVKTNIVTAVEIHGQWASDVKLLPALVDATAQNFKMTEVSADKGYGSMKNADVIAKTGATPFIAFAAHHTGSGSGTWAKMYHYFQFRKDEFLAHYHKRSNVESTFSMMKRKFGDGLRSKTDVAMVNETLCKILAHNLVVLIHETHELGIEPVFWSTNAA